MFYWVLKILFAPLIGLIWIKKVQGLDNIPKKGAYIIAANHCSYFDFFSLAAIWPDRIYFLAGEVFFKKWWWYPLVKFTGQIRVDRKSEDKTGVKQKVFLALEQGKIVGIFPEGTRSPDGKIGKTYIGVAKFALDAKVPVVPVGIMGTYEILSRHKKWPKFEKSIEIRIGEPICFEECYKKTDNEINLRGITDKIMEKIINLTDPKL